VCYTIDTLRELRDGGDSPVFVLGADALLAIHTWHAWDRLVTEFDLAVVDRPGVALLAGLSRLPDLVSSRIARVDAPFGADEVCDLAPGRGGRIFHLPIEPIPISSSEIRRRAASEESLAGLVPTAVARYIQSTRIYQEARP
jgi:nicotinate-nucleotide adenylyltransferase